tara:strand:- start:351 stop:725 length:375 start_codon:yes stop_codon:yes gene_type:complete
MIIKDNSFTQLYTNRVEGDNGDIESISCIDVLGLYALSIIPRYYPTGVVSFNIKDTTTGYDNTQEVSYSIVNGVLSFTFSLETTNETRYQVTLSEGTEVVYRGIAIYTTQNTQEYQLTNDKYYF